MREHAFVPWRLRKTEAEVRAAIADGSTWRDVLDVLGYTYHGKTIAVLRKWAGLWGISTSHLSDERGRSHCRLGYGERELRAAIAASYSWAEALRRLGYCPTGGNPQTLKKRVAKLGISTDHFDPYRAARQQGRRRRIALEEVLVEGSTYSRASLKQRLYEEGLKDRRCERCGQDEFWLGNRIGLILDHVNGVRNDNRLENLQILCPNCAAALETHCGRKNRLEVETRNCVRCTEPFTPRYAAQRYCSAPCGRRWDRRGRKRPGARRTDRPPRDQLLEEIDRLGYLAVGRKYGVSDNAIRKWIRQYERELASEEGRDPEVIEIPKRTWPNRRREDLDEAA